MEMSPRTIHEVHILYTSVGRLDVREGLQASSYGQSELLKNATAPVEYYTNQIKYTAHQDFPHPNTSLPIIVLNYFLYPLGP
jgi:hypothetical protein